MFERNRIDKPFGTERTPVAIEVTLDSGEHLHGKVYVGAGRSVGEELNSPSGFIDFEAHHGQRSFLSKQSVQSISLQQIPRADQFARAQAKSSDFNPWLTLGLAENSGKEEIREAYHRLVKQYHPDRFLRLPRRRVQVLPRHCQLGRQVGRRQNQDYN